MCNFIEYKGKVQALCLGQIKVLMLDISDTKVVYRRYASLFFVMGIGQSDNELVALEIIHRYVELLDKYFGNVSSCCCLIFLATKSLY